MIMADVLTVLLVILGFWLTVPSLCLLARALMPGRVEGSRMAVTARPGRTLLTGLGIWLPTALVAGTIGRGPGPAKLLAAVLLTGLLLYTFTGLAGLATHIGERLPSPVDAGRPWMATVRGAVLIQVPSTLPFLGWFVMVPALFLLGAGAHWRGRSRILVSPPTVAASSEPLAPLAEGTGE